MQKPVVYVIYTEDGLPRWFGPEPVTGSTPLDLEELRPLLPADAPESALAAACQWLLITHRKVDGTWLLREVVEPDPSPEPAPDDPEAGGPENEGPEDGGAEGGGPEDGGPD